MQRNTEGLIRQDTQVPEADTSMDQTLSGIAGFGQTIIQQEQHSKILNSVAQAQLNLTQLSQEYRSQNADNPLGGLDDLKEKRAAILQQYGDQISPFFRKQWDMSARELSLKMDTTNEIWAYRQMRLNTIKNLNTSMQTNFQQANIDGQNFGLGQGTMTEALANFAANKKTLQDFGEKNIGDRAGAILENYDKDSMKAFISGVAEKNPQKAAQMLQDPEIQGRFTTEERGDFADQIAKTQKQMDLTKSLQTTQNAQSITDLVNDPSDTYMNKRLKIDKMSLAGQISPEIAGKAIRVLNAQKDVDAVTDSGEMGKIVQNIYDLNSNQSMNNSDYLKGVQGIHEMILEKQAQGLLNPQDVIKMNNELRTMTSKRVSDATRSFGNDMSEATDKFNTLPPEYRGEAMRQLFYATSGKQDSMTDEQFQAMAKQRAAYIADQISMKRHSAAQAVVNSVNSVKGEDVDLLRSKGYTMDDLQETAQKYHMTPQQVIQRLRQAAHQ